jgi:predicted nucleic acid-binding protein
MPRPRILDTNVLINHWHRFEGTRRTASEFRAHAKELIEVQGTNLIVSPVVVEFLAGASREDLNSRRAYLEPFEILDKGNIPAADWDEAKRFAQWIRRGRERKLGDCLIEAIARRLNGDIISSDRDFKWRVPPQ